MARSMTDSNGILQGADRYRLVFETAPVGVLVFDRDYRVVDCNDALAEFLHSKRERVVGLDLRKIPDQRIRPAIDAALAGEHGLYQGPYRSVTSGAQTIAHLRTRPLRDVDGQLCGGVAVVEDATEHVRVQEDLLEQLEVVKKQAATIHALGTPILKVWDEVLCLPVIGTLEHDRVTEMTETMLNAIIGERARFAIIDVTGVEVVDTTTAQHLVQLIRAASLVGAEGLLCGLRPAVAQTIVSLGGELGVARTMRTMQQALQYCLRVLDDGD